MELTEIRRMRLARVALNRKLMDLRGVEGVDPERQAAIAALHTLADEEDALVASLDIDECSVAYQMLMYPSISESSLASLTITNDRLRSLQSVQST